MKRKRGDGLLVCRCGSPKNANAMRCMECYNPSWRADQDERLREFVAAGLEYAAMARILKRTANACRLRASFLGIRLERTAVLENRKLGRDRFWSNQTKVNRWKKRLSKTFTADERAVRAEEARQMNAAGVWSFKGHHHTPEVCERIRAAQLGRKASAETKRRMSEARKAYFAAKRDGGQAAYLAALLADQGRFRRVDDDKHTEENRVWCAQCERQVTVASANACASPFCKAKVLAA